MYTRFLLILMVTGMYACTFTSSDKKETSGKEYTSAYICPMHCEGSGSDEPGTCPVCGMDYEPNPHHNEHNQSDKYVCPMHEEETGVVGDSCGVCGMALEQESDE